MKKLFLFTVLFTIAALSFAQERETEKSASEAVRFEKSVGSLIKKDFYNLEDAENFYKIDVLILTNVLSGAKVGCLRWENRYKADYMSSSYIPYIGTLDFDELDPQSNRLPTFATPFSPLSRIITQKLYLRAKTE